MTQALSEILDRFPGRRVLVVGDAILDHYVIGEVSRTSPEAPVPILTVGEDRWLPGGAANVARNLAALDAEVIFASACGNDEAGDRLIGLIGETPAIRLELIRTGERPTTIKTRCVAQGQQMLRLDREVTTDLSPRLEGRLIRLILRQIKRVDGVIFSDYGKGVLTNELVATVASEARKAGKEVVVDPKGTDYRRYRGVTMITPNRKEAEQATGTLITDDAAAAKAASQLQKVVAGRAVCITLGAHGVAVFTRRGKPLRISARAREVFDVTGAGDTFIATMALARFSGATFNRAAELGNTAAGLVVARTGVAAITRIELEREIQGETSSRKWMGIRELRGICQSLALAGRRIVFTNGCFDILNVSHLRLLEQARALGDVLIVALNSDESVRKLKGAPRPLLTATERVDLISSLPYVDYVTVFDGHTPNELLRTLKPDILVKGDTSQEVVGRGIVEAYGGEVRLLDTGTGPSDEEMIRRVTDGTRPRKAARK